MTVKEARTGMDCHGCRAIKTNIRLGRDIFVKTTISMLQSHLIFITLVNTTIRCTFAARASTRHLASRITSVVKERENSESRESGERKKRGERENRERGEGSKQDDEVEK